jgi:hypothetical protein
LIEIALDAVYVPNGFQGYIFLRGVSVTVLVFYCVVYLSTLRHDNFAAIEEVVDNVQFSIEATMTFLFLKTLDTHGVWTQMSRSTLLLALLFSLYYVGYAQLISDDDNSAFATARSVLFFSFMGGCLLTGFQWLYRLVIHCRQSGQPLLLSSLSFNDYYIVVIIANWFFLGVSMTIAKAVFDYSTVELRVAVTIIRTVFTFVIAFIPGRMIRHQSLQYYLTSETEHLDRENQRLEDMLRMKRTFVRHVSHEVRYAAMSPTILVVTHSAL